MKRLLWLATTMTALALLCLLGYSLERSTWLFSLFEEDEWLPLAAAVVVELAAVALLVGAGALQHIEARAWANRALGVVLSVQALANLSAGYLRGDWETLGRFGDGRAAYAVTATLWLVTNLAVPALVLFLSKLLERLIAALVVRESTVTVGRGAIESAAEVVTAESGAPEAAERSTPVLVLSDESVAAPPSLSKTARIRQLAAEHGVSVSTMWRKVGAGEVTLNGVEN